MSETQAPEATPTGPITVLIAVDEHELSLKAVREAHRLFGDTANYFVVNVGAGHFSSMSYASVYPVMSPVLWEPPPWDDGAADADTSGTATAANLAGQIAEEGSLGDATMIGAVGDPASAIVKAAHKHAADVVVIGAHEKNWFARLFTGTVERDLLHDADFAVMVVK